MNGKTANTMEPLFAIIFLSFAAFPMRSTTKALGTVSLDFLLLSFFPPSFFSLLAPLYWRLLT